MVKNGKDKPILVEGRSISKGFPGVWENLILDRVDFDVRAGEIHTLLGENGAGKTVLANVLSGFYGLTSGEIYIKGKLVNLRSPRDGLEYGIGMVHQELMLVPPFTVTENIALGLTQFNFSLPLHRIEKRIRRLSSHYQLEVDPRARVEDLSAGEQQRVEILKVLYHEPEVLILDEPTSLLTPEEAEHLFALLRRMAEDGHGIVFITHKMKEVMKISDRVTVLKLGRLMGTKKLSETDEDELIRMMFGQDTPAQIKKEPVRKGRVLLEVRDLHAVGPEGKAALNGVSFELCEGQILGVAGIAGNGQSELIEVITGLRKATKGQVIIFGKEMTNRSPQIIADLGVAHIPEKRREVGVIEAMSVAENIILRDHRKTPFSRKLILNLPQITQHSERLISEFNVLVPDLWRSETRILSGGNIQRLILGRETWLKPPLIIASHPTEGLDAHAISHTWRLFMKLCKEGSAILLVSEDLEEIMALSDRIAVIFEGKIVDILNGKEVKREQIGSMMATGSLKEGKEE